MKFIFLPLLFCPILHLFGQAGTPAAGFGVNGKVTTPIGSGYEEIRAIAMQADGKIVAAGISNTGSTNNFAVVRYNTDGTPDNTFDGDGKQVTVFGAGTYDVANAVALQSDGKIVLSGYTINGGNYNFAVARYNTDGTPDNTFDGDGKLTTDLGGFDVAYGMALQTDGKIIVAGQSGPGGNGDFTAVRYNTDGSLDNSFDGDGKLVVVTGTNQGIIRAVAVQPDGKIIFAGHSHNGSNYDFCLVRCNTNGTPDNGFGTNGKVITAIGTGTDVVLSVALQADGKIIAAGSNNNGSKGDFALARYTTNGTLDNTFGSGGKVTTAFDGANDEIDAVALQADGKIVAAGRNGSDFLIARYTSGGSLDNSFDGDGKATVDFGGTELLYAMKLSGYRIYVAGNAVVSGNGDFAIATLQNDAAPLPLKLLSFAAQRQAASVELRWRTTSEENISFFEIERSDDNRAFRSIGSVKAAGNSVVEQNYFFEDKAQRSGKTFYRLKIIEADGSSHLGSVAMLQAVLVTGLRIYPNPVVNALMEVRMGKPVQELTIHDAIGRTVQAIPGGQGSTLLSVNVQHLPKGLYYLKAGDETQTFIRQ